MDIKEKIKKFVLEAIRLKFPNFSGSIDIEHPKDFKNGDYSCISIMKSYAALRKKEKNNIYVGGHQIFIQELVVYLNSNKPDYIREVRGIGAGFINFYLSRKFFAGSVEEILNNENFAHNKLFAGKKIMVEYTDPNPFKPFHIGHLMTNAIGESIARILESSGATVSRANYQGDVGLHVAKAIWGLLKDSLRHSDTSPLLKGRMNGNESITVLAQYIGDSYVLGSEAYEGDSKAKKEIDEINKKIYARDDEKLNAIYDWGFKVTMEAFENIYKMLGTKFDYYFLESQVAPLGANIVRENIGKVFEKSNGAIIFKAEKHSTKLHTRVFITSEDLPTYESKELGLALEKFKTEPDMNLSIVVTANEQADYMKVVAKAISLIHPEYTDKMKHITHGMMRLARKATAEGLTSGKMGSRKGNAVTGESLINDARLAIFEKIKDRDFSKEEKEKIAMNVGVSAIKYSILKQSTGGDIVYDFEKSISFEGDSGPYLQYSYARANSILEKAEKENILPDPHAFLPDIFEIEKLLYRFPEIVFRSASEYEPHHIASYLIELARAFNSFYGNTLIVDKKDSTSSYKVALTYAFSFVLKTGLHLLGIEAPEKM